MYELFGCGWCGVVCVEGVVVVCIGVVVVGVGVGWFDGFGLCGRY